METKLVIDSWEIKNNENKGKTIAGEYCIMLGKMVVARSFFNKSEYGSGTTEIAIPAELMIKVERLDEEIRRVIIENFTG